MKKQTKSFAVLGLGRFGSNIARTLEEYGAQVLAVDSREEKVEEIADEVTHAVQADVTELSALRSMGIADFDGVIVAIGENMETSIITIMHLKDLGAKHIIAKAQNELHAKVLKRIGANRVILPEKDMAVRVGHGLVNGNILDYIELSEEYGIYEIAAPKEWQGNTLVQLNLRARLGINVMAVHKNGGEFVVSPGAEYLVSAGDQMVVIARKDIMDQLVD